VNSGRLGVSNPPAYAVATKSNPHPTPRPSPVFPAGVFLCREFLFGEGEGIQKINTSIRFANSFWHFFVPCVILDEIKRRGTKCPKPPPLPATLS
jgi:hypothetical protein